LKIGPHLPNLLLNIKGHTFWGHSVQFQSCSVKYLNFRVEIQPFFLKFIRHVALHKVL